MKTKRRAVTKIGILAIGMSLSLAACSSASNTASSNDGSTGAADAGSAGPSGVHNVKSASELKIAFFEAGSSNSYLQANISAAKEAAADAGAQLDVFDGQWTAATQANQIQTAMTSKKYNAFMVLPVDGNQVCNQLQDAMSSGVIVTVLNVPICGRDSKVGDATWTPGTVTYIGGQTLPVYEGWVSKVIHDNPQGGTVGLISGPSTSANTKAFFTAAEELTKHGFTIVGKQNTDYTTPKGYSAAQAMLQANPSLTVLMSNYSGVTQGVVQAVSDASRTGKISIYDVGGDKWGLSQVKAGALKGTVMLLPKEETAQSVQALVQAVEGKTVPRFIDLSKCTCLPDGPYVNADNVDTFSAEY